MPKVVVTHPVSDVAQWASKHSERAAAFAPFASNLVEYFPGDGSNVVAVTLDVHDMAGLQAALGSPAVAALKKSHGVLDPMMVFVEKS